MRTRPMARHPSSCAPSPAAGFSLERMTHQTLDELGKVFNPACYDYDYPGSTVWPTLEDIPASEQSKALRCSSAIATPQTSLAPFSSGADVVPLCGEESTFGEPRQAVLSGGLRLPRPGRAARALRHGAELPLLAFTKRPWAFTKQPCPVRFVL
ncbi:unnamed protein product [Prorocentrum cordatum]|uniref:Uncharacterized protein n=1 Tax=Prorocentrum cordatum TaxID=2364126 RepID=A0ABN9TWU4_9DINO|nr:unnamed protein product [Polarella glacialis]